MHQFLISTIALLLCSAPPSVPQNPPPPIGGVLPGLTVRADGIGSTSEAGIGAMIPWANKLWAIGYVAHIKGDGIGLYAINDDMTMTKQPESVTGTFANRMIHWETGQAIIGPHVIDANGKVRTIEALKTHRLAATARHLNNPETMAYFLTMESLLFEVDLQTLEATQLFDLVQELGIQGQPHFKAAHTAQGKLVVANNTYEEPEFLGRRASGCLAQFDGASWSIVERNPFVEVSGKQNPSAGERFGNTLFATGWDKASVILRVYHDGKWSRYLLPKASQTFDHTWNTEWMRIREAQTERYIMDVHGMFYELPTQVYDGRIWGIRPISTHLRIVPDFCYWQGLFVMAGDQTDNATGQPQSNFWFGNIDDLWNMGKPKGWGGPWWEEDVRADTFSDPFLMTGFDKKVLHLAHESEETVKFTVEVDFLGDGNWKWYDTFEIPPKGYQHHVFPDGYSAHWIRIKVDKNCNATAYFMYN